MVREYVAYDSASTYLETRCIVQNILLNSFGKYLQRHFVFSHWKPSIRNISFITSEKAGNRQLHEYHMHLNFHWSLPCCPCATGVPKMHEWDAVSGQWDFGHTVRIPSARWINCAVHEVQKLIQKQWWVCLVLTRWGLHVQWDCSWPSKMTVKGDTNRLACLHFAALAAASRQDRQVLYSNGKSFALKEQLFLVSNAKKRFSLQNTQLTSAQFIRCCQLGRGGWWVISSSHFLQFAFQQALVGLKGLRKWGASLLSLQPCLRGGGHHFWPSVPFRKDVVFPSCPGSAHSVSHH